MELEELNFLTLDYTAKLQSSRQYGTGTKTEIWPMEQDTKPRDKPMHLKVPYFFTKKARIYNGGKDSLFS